MHLSKKWLGMLVDRHPGWTVEDLIVAIDN